MLANAWATTTATVLVAVSEPSEIVTVNVYAPAAANVTVVAWAAWVPLAAKAGDAPAGAAVAAQL